MVESPTGRRRNFRHGTSLTTGAGLSCRRHHRPQSPDRGLFGNDLMQARCSGLVARRDTCSVAKLVRARNPAVGTMTGAIHAENAGTLAGRGRGPAICVMAGFVSHLGHAVPYSTPNSRPWCARQLPLRSTFCPGWHFNFQRFPRFIEKKVRKTGPLATNS